MYFPGHFPLVFATVEELPDKIDNIDQARISKVLNILVSDDIYDITLHVPGSFTRLNITRCVSTRNNGDLFIDGRSTYNKIRFDRWGDTRHKKHSIVISPSIGVVITVPDFRTQPPWGLHGSPFTTTQQEELARNLMELSKRSHWSEARALLAAIVGLVAGVGKVALDFKAVAGGFYTKVSWGKRAFEFGAAAAKVSGSASMVGGAVLLGAGVAAAVYFIPWDSFFGWLKNSVVSLWGRICEWWEGFMSKMRVLFRLGDQNGNLPQHHAQFGLSQ